MKKYSKIILKACLLICAFLSVLTITKIVQAEDTVSVSEPWAQSTNGRGVYYGLCGYYIADDQNILNLINQIRYEACEEGVPDPRDKSRNLTLSDYVPLKWSYGLERIARDRAVEASVSIAHEKLNGDSIFNTTYNGVGPYAENLAWNWQANMSRGIYQFYEEKSDWLNYCSGNAYGVYGHYTSMINPYYNYVGVGDFYSENTYYVNTLAMNLTRASASLDETMLSGTAQIYQKVQVCDERIESKTITFANTLYSGQSTTMQTIVGVLAAELVPLGSITYSSSDTSLATVTNDGTINGIKAGDVTITAYVDGVYFASATVTILCEHNYVFNHTIDSDNQVTGTCSKCGDVTKESIPSEFKLYWKDSADYSGIGVSSRIKLPIGSTINFTIYSMTGYTGLHEIQLTSSDPNVLKFPNDILTEENSVVATVTGIGFVEVTVQATYNPKLTNTYRITVGEEGVIDISKVKMTIPKDFSGDTETIQLTYDGKVLEEGIFKDYCIYATKYEDDYYYICVTGYGIFSGEIEKYYLLENTVSLEKSTHAYTGKAIKPQIKSIYIDKNLVNGKDYTLKYSNNTQIGKAKVTVTFQGSYVGCYTRTFTIQPSKVVPKSIKNSYKSITLQWKHNKVCTGYKIYRKIGNEKYKILATVNNKVSSYQDTSANSNGRKYTYKIVAYKKISKVVYNASASSEIAMYYLAKPSLSLRNISTRKVKVAWNKNSKATGYQIKYVYGKTTKTITSTNSTTKKTIGSLKKGATYTFYIRSYYKVSNKIYYSAWSNAKKVKITR